MLLYAKARTTGTYTACSDTPSRTQTEMLRPGYSRSQSLHLHKQTRFVEANILSSHVPNHADDPPLSHEHGSLLTTVHATPQATVAAQSAAKHTTHQRMILSDSAPAPGLLHRWSSPRELADHEPDRLVSCPHSQLCRVMHQVLYPPVRLGPVSSDRTLKLEPLVTEMLCFCHHLHTST